MEGCYAVNGPLAGRDIKSLCRVMAAIIICTHEWVSFLRNLQLWVAATDARKLFFVLVGSLFLYLKPEKNLVF